MEPVETLEGQQQNEYDVTPKQFKEHLAHLNGEFKKLMQLSGAIANLDKGETLIHPDGTRIGRRELRSLESQYCKDVLNLAKFFSQAKKKPKTKRTGGSNGFKNAMFVTDNLKQFFASDDLGLAYIKQDDGTFVQGEKLKNYLHLFLQQGVTSSALLTPLFSIYAHVHKMQDPTNRSFLHATSSMMKYFGDTFSKLPVDDQEKVNALRTQLAELVKSGASQEEIEKLQKKLETPNLFDPSHFKYSRFQSIAARNRVPKELLTPEQLQYLKDLEVRQRLDEEQRLVSSTLEYYRVQTEADRKVERAAKRRQQKK